MGGKTLSYGLGLTALHWEMNHAQQKAQLPSKPSAASAAQRHVTRPLAHTTGNIDTYPRATHRNPPWAAVEGAASTCLELMGGSASTQTRYVSQLTTPTILGKTENSGYGSASGTDRPLSTSPQIWALGESAAFIMPRKTHRAYNYLYILFPKETMRYLGMPRTRTISYGHILTFRAYLRRSPSGD